jgi:hypothetical protein
VSTRKEVEGAFPAAGFALDVAGVVPGFGVALAGLPAGAGLCPGAAAALGAVLGPAELLCPAELCPAESFDEQAVSAPAETTKARQTTAARRDMSPILHRLEPNDRPTQIWCS